MPTRLSRLKLSMCGTKQSFRSRGAAEKIATKFNQRIYECPICFCWHCTKSQDWHDEFVRKDYMEKRLTQQESTIRGEMNSTIRALRFRIAELEAQLGKYGVTEKERQ